MPKRASHKKTEVTNDQLARMIAEGFADTATKGDIREVNQRINSVEKRIESVE